MKRFFIFVLLFTSLPVAALDVVLLNPSNGQSVFWQRVTALTQGAANDLAINLEIINSDSNHVLQITHINQIISRNKKPDYVIFMPYKESIIQTFNALEKARIPFVTLEKIYGEKKAALVGLPQAKYQYWLGEMYNDNIKASTELSKTLINHAIKLNNKRALQTAIAITGDNFIGSFKRWHGFKQVCDQYQQLTLAQVIRANWSRNIARSKYAFLRKKYPNIAIVWTASDQMALGVVDELKNQQRNTGKPIIIGGFDWIPEALNAIKNGELTASVGGHFLQGAWTLIKIFDHHQGKKVFKKLDDTAYIEMLVADKTNIERYHFLATELDLERINFAKFSLTHSANKQKEKGYQFGVNQFISNFD